jgi:hypothetical protein
MLDCDTWMKVKTECENEAQVSFQRMSRAAQKAMQDGSYRLRVPKAVRFVKVATV